MKGTLHLFALCLPTLFITGCGSDSNSPSPDRSMIPSVSIVAFDVVGSDDTTAEAASISAGMNDGAFSINWDISEGNTFSINIFLSHDNVVSADDITLFSGSACGNLRINDCNAQDTLPCTFAGDNTLRCDDGFEPFETNLQDTGFLTAIPQSASIIGKVCVLTECELAVVPVEFQ